MNAIAPHAPPGRCQPDSAEELIALAWREDVSLLDQANAAVVRGRAAGLTLRDPPPGLRAALHALCHPCGVAMAALEDRVLSEDGTEGLAVWLYQLDRLARLNLLRHVVGAGGMPILSAWVMDQTGLLPVGPLVEGVRYRISRFACLHAEAGRLLVDTPLAAARIAIHAPRLGALVVALAAPHDIAALTVAAGDLPATVVRSCLRLLAAARIIFPETDGTLAEERDTPLRQWQFHDLLFHARSRLGRHDEGFGGTFRFREVIPPLPATRQPVSENTVTLPSPDLAACAARDPPLTRVMESRRSHRRHGKQAITLDQLGEFLFRVARIKDVIPPDPARHRFYETSRRPYPSGGATYDLELYLTVGRCDGLLPGLYHYDALGHTVCRISDLNKMTDLLMEGARLAAKTTSPPQVLITLTSRFQRLSWKYETIAYATTLKNVGVLYQTMYLVASAMNLAPCALGGGHSDLFARATGNDYVTESSVGEFMLGTREEDGPG